ncbi:hypothetical protein MXB_2799, partial [Myxobolus squamalis]
MSNLFDDYFNDISNIIKISLLSNNSQMLNNIGFLSISLSYTEKNNSLISLKSCIDLISDDQFTIVNRYNSLVMMSSLLSVSSKFHYAIHAYIFQDEHNFFPNILNYLRCLLSMESHKNNDNILICSY